MGRLLIPGLVLLVAGSAVFGVVLGTREHAAREARPAVRPDAPVRPVQSPPHAQPAQPVPPDPAAQPHRTAPERPTPRPPSGEQIRAAQRKIAEQLATELALESPVREKFVADYLDYVEGVLLTDPKTTRYQDTKTLVAQRRAEFDARVATYLDAAQQQKLRDLLAR